MPPKSRRRFVMSPPALAAGFALMLSGLCLAGQQGPSPANSRSTPEASSQSGASPKQCQIATQPSLGDLARKQRAEQAQASRKPAKVYTNDNMPAAAGNLTILGPPEGQGGAEAAAGTAGDRHGQHPEEYYRARARELNERLDTHRRELDVLQQKLGENQVQYYPNPSQAVEQQYSRDDINRLREAIQQKQQQVDQDQHAILDLEDELRRQDGDPGWVQPEAPGTSSLTVHPDLSGVEKNSEEYWRRRFSAARETLARAQEQRQLAEDQLRLLQSQQAHDWGTAGAVASEPKIQDKQSELESKQAAEAQAQQELGALENEFQHSGAPEEWSQPADATPDSSSPQPKP